MVKLLNGLMVEQTFAGTAHAARSSLQIYTCWPVNKVLARICKPFLFNAKIFNSMYNFNN